MTVVDEEGRLLVELAPRWLPAVFATVGSLAVDESIRIHPSASKMKLLRAYLEAHHIIVRAHILMKHLFEHTDIGTSV